VRWVRFRGLSALVPFGSHHAWGYFGGLRAYLREHGGEQEQGEEQRIHVGVDSVSVGSGLRSKGLRYRSKELAMVDACTASFGGAWRIESSCQSKPQPQGRLLVLTNTTCRIIRDPVWNPHRACMYGGMVHLITIIPPL